MEQFVNNFGVVTEILLYISFAILMGGLLLSIIPEGKKPPMYIPKSILLITVILIPILSFTPLLEVILVLSTNIGFGNTMKNILSSYEVGKAWLFTTVVSVALLVLIFGSNIKNNKVAISLGIFLTVILTFSVGYGSHASSITNWVGFVSHSLHFLAVTVWAGIVLLVGWFSYNQKKAGEKITPTFDIANIPITVSGIIGI